ncbi:hypothetical protein SMACR_01484 [Sordaria macrospora]|uniref:WGS project CABT00000000 data, contig 2.4 n=2 Tax=Sordaria macrospora TaxID=5147 RepID=F7VQY8_SORMK|nr:uncharacterized protein SMAC_01484 [Sordaria macrospora k-hell]KAA8632200.1 hypothetical protein SMACR_01484 [Sordaria macrospora]KAH7634586.1 chaperonin 10-like protein [Sordaria sp. MPI-SDFR-AT-0083]WPJ58631.1 hypothetical protein SMAC4_01484 [Sordaria macrospora]CCC07921.1 unnamed protein product [Sordaria macrospora k-hell]
MFTPPPPPRQPPSSHKTSAPPSSPPPQNFRAVVLPAPTRPLKIHTLPLPTPGPNQLLICAGDAVIATGLLPQTSYPTILGHEYISDVFAIGPITEGQTAGPQFKIGDRIGGHCTTCPPCLRGQQQTCSSQQIAGVSHNGAHAEYTLLRTQAAV